MNHYFTTLLFWLPQTMGVALLVYIAYSSKKKKVVVATPDNTKRPNQESSKIQQSPGLNKKETIETSIQELKLSAQFSNWLKKQKDANNSELDILSKYYDTDYPNKIMKELNKHCKNYKNPENIMELESLLNSLKIVKDC